MPPVGKDRKHVIDRAQVVVIPDEYEIIDRGGFGDAKIIEPAAAATRRFPGVEDVVLEVRRIGKNGRQM
jgi:hypothetical protein